MEVRLTITVPNAGRSTDVIVTAPAGDTLASVLSTLLGTAGVDPGTGLWCAGKPIDGRRAHR